MTASVARPRPDAAGGRRPGAVGVAALVLVCAAGLLSGVLELLFVPVYVGGVIAPFTVLAAVVGNVVLPRLGAAALNGRTLGAALPVVCWLVPVLLLALITRPEGDLLVLGAQNQQYVYYALLLVGVAVGFGTTVVTRPR